MKLSFAEVFTQLDVLSVPHRLENLFNDFAAWVVCYGANGGEKIAETRP